MLRHVSGAYYAHPYAWDEIGYGGPAYPRGYMALSFGNPDPWDVDEEPDPSLSPPDCVATEQSGTYPEKA